MGRLVIRRRKGNDESENAFLLGLANALYDILCPILIPKLYLTLYLA